MVEFESLLAEQEVPPDFVWLLKYLFSEVLDAATPTWRTACSAPSAASRGTSASSRERRRDGTLESVGGDGLNQRHEKRWRHRSRSPVATGSGRLV